MLRRSSLAPILACTALFAFPLAAQDHGHAAQAANRLGIVVTELSAEQKKDMRLANGLVVTDVRPDARADVRRGDVILKVVHNGQHTDLKSTEQFNKLLSGLDKNAVITLQVRRGENTAFITVSGLADKG